MTNYSTLRDSKTFSSVQQTILFRRDYRRCSISRPRAKWSPTCAIVLRVVQQATQAVRNATSLFLWDSGSFRMLSEQHPRRELRCVVCGYHFLEEDAGSRVDFLRDCETVFAQTREPGRLEDLFKPRSYTQLELDHIVSEEGFGWSDPDKPR